MVATPRSWFTTTFAFCFEMREGILLFSAFQAFTAIFWLASSSFSLESWPQSEALRGLSIVLLAVNAALGCAASRLRSERCAQALVVTFGCLVLSLTISMALEHPSQCASEEQADESALGRLISRLLWTTDACLLMTILAWVNIGVGYAMTLYMWYMCLCFWKVLHVASALTPTLTLTPTPTPTLTPTLTLTRRCCTWRRPTGAAWHVPSRRCPHSGSKGRRRRRRARHYSRAMVAVS